MPKKLAIITTHPIQYNAPWFRLLTQRNKIQVKVFYTWSQVEKQEKFDPGFGKNIKWDIPLLEGYEYEFVENISKNPGTRKHNGIINPGLIKVINDHKPDGILVNGWNFNSHIKCLKYFHKKIPVLFRGDSTLLDEQQEIRKLFRQIVLKKVYTNVDYALYVGSENKKYFLKHGLTEDQLIFVPHAVDNNRFAGNDFDKKNASEIKKRLHILKEDLVFLFAGKLEFKKDPQLLIEAFNKIHNQNIHLVIVGNGELETKLKQSTAETPNIHFLEFQNQQTMPSIYQMADLFVLPSKGPGETWGMAVNEAMAAGKPILVSDHCGCAQDLVEAGISGYIFRSNDAEDLRKKLELMISQKNDLKYMGKNAFEKIQNWSFDHIAEAIEELVINKC